MPRLTKPNWLLLTIGLPFLIGGSLVGFVAARSVIRGLAARGWPEVPARILAAELRSHRGSKGSVTYDVAATYEYRFDGRTFRGTRVSVFGGSDSGESFHRRVADELGGYRERGEPFRAFVNPADPGDAVLYPDLRYGLLFFMSIFVILFGGVGALMVGGSFLGLGADRGYRRPRPKNRAG